MRGIRSMNVVDMLDAIVDLIYEVITEMRSDAQRRIAQHGPDAVTLFAAPIRERPCGVARAPRGSATHTLGRTACDASLGRTAWEAA